MLGKEQDEEAAQEDPTNPTTLSFGYGLVSLWSAVVGYYIYTLYPKAIKDDAWWKVQCPATAYTADTYAKVL